MTEALNLADNFPIWYQDVSVDADEARRSVRLEGIDTLTAEADRELIEGLVRIAIGVDRQDPSHDVLARVHKSFKDSDPTFDPVNSAREIQVLAAATLVNLFANSSHQGDIAALSVSTASVDSSRKFDLPMDLPSLAETTLDDRSIEARERPDLDKHNKPQAFKIGNSIAEIPEGGLGGAVNESQLLAMAKEVQTSLRAVANRQTSVVNALARFIKVQDEELQVLWWFIGGRSAELDCDFGEIPAAAKPLVFGKELADETYVLPGLRTIRPLLARAGIREKSKLSIPDAINGADADWLKSLIGDMTPSPITQPVHFAIVRKLEVNDDNAWVDAWASLTGIKPKQTLNRLTLAELFYREQLLRQFK